MVNRFHSLWLVVRQHIMEETHGVETVCAPASQDTKEIGRAWVPMISLKSTACHWKISN